MEHVGRKLDGRNEARGLKEKRECVRKKKEMAKSKQSQMLKADQTNRGSSILQKSSFILSLVLVVTI